MFHRLPDEPTTPEQWQVIVWSVILLLLVVGSVGFYYAWQAPPEKVEIAQQLRGYSLACYGLAVAIYFIKRAVAMFMGTRNCNETGRTIKGQNNEGKKMETRSRVDRIHDP